MLATFLGRIRVWRFVENFIHVSLVGVLLAAVFVFYNDIERTSIELILVGSFAILVACWYLVGSVIRVNLKRSLAQAAYSARQEFDSLYEHSPMAYLTVDSRGDILRANPASAHLFKDTMSDIVRRNFYNFVVSESADNNDTIFRGKVLGGLTVTDLELPIRTVPGTERWVMVSVFTADNSDERLVSVTDITDKRAVDTAKSEFVALATHQLRTPIAAIRWNVDLLTRSMKESKTEKQDRYLVKVNRNVLRMLNLINDFLSVSQLEMGTYTAERETVDFAEYLKSILEEFEEKVTTKKLTINVELKPEAFKASIDSRLFHIITSNLLSNAVKYTPANGVVTVKAQAQDGILYYSVSDTGIGIPEKEQKQLFTKFFRASNAKEKVSEGTGLGLFVVKQSVEMLGGTLKLESTENQGTTFYVELPGTVE